jgi:hypothetical protein
MSKVDGFEPAHCPQARACNRLRKHQKQHENSSIAPQVVVRIQARVRSRNNKKSRDY